MAKSSEGASGGVGICTVLLIVFVVLKLVGVIDWSWWLVTLPFWGPLAAVVALVALAIVGILLLTVVAAVVSRF